MGYGQYSSRGGAGRNTPRGTERAKDRDSKRRVKTVFDKGEVAHIWAQRQQDSGRSTHGNFYFVGDVLYSYGSHYIAAQFIMHKGRVAVLINSESYSVTTSGHIRLAADAVRGLGFPVFHVPGAKIDHGAALKYFDTEAQAFTAKANRARAEHSKRWNTQRAGFLAQQFREYAEFFELGDTSEALAKQERKAKREKAKAAKDQAKRDAERREREREQFDKWLAGAADYCPHSFSTDENGSVYLRLVRREDEDSGAPVVETSRGARVLLSHALKLYQMAKLCRKRGKGFKPNGAKLKVTHYDVNSIDAEGNATVGCHFLSWATIETAAQRFGVADTVAADTSEHA